MEIRGVAWSADDRYVASVSDDASVHLWNPDTGREMRVLEGHEGRVLSVAFSGDGHYVVSGGWDGTARVWEASTGLQVRVMHVPDT